MRRRILVTLAALACLALAVTACGSGSGPATISIGALQRAAVNSQQAETQSFEFTADVDAKGQQLSMHGSGT